MTPDDVAAIRAEWEPMHYVDGRRERVLALCSALEAAWAEARDTEIDVDALCLTLAKERERAERAEQIARAEIGMRREADADARNRQAESKHWFAEYEKAEAALAEALELAAEAIPYAGEYFDEKWALTERLNRLRALDEEAGQ